LPLRFLRLSRSDTTRPALKHHTSKLRSYDDLENLDTFGFRGEALASLCALSQLYIITAREMDRPRGTRLEFEVSGKLKSTSTIAAQRGTKVVVEEIFHNLPVRKKELEKNIKREYGKVLTLLQAYACISTGVRFTVSNQMPKGYISTRCASITVIADHFFRAKTSSFSTNGSAATKDNIIKVFGPKSLRDLVALDLKFDMPLVVSKSKGTYPNLCSEKAVQRQTDKCSMSIHGLVAYLKSQRLSTRCTRHSTFLNLLSSSQI
jgi:DNA mismatch repair protein PMS2